MGACEERAGWRRKERVLRVETEGGRGRMKQPPPPGGAGFCKNSGQRLRLSPSLSLSPTPVLLQHPPEAPLEGGRCCRGSVVHGGARRGQEASPTGARTLEEKPLPHLCFFFFFACCFQASRGRLRTAWLLVSVRGVTAFCGGGGAAGEALVMLAFCAQLCCCAGRGWVGGWKRRREKLLCLRGWLGWRWRSPPSFLPLHHKHLWEGKRTRSE